MKRKAKKVSNSKERIAEMLSTLNITQIDLAKRSGISKSALSNYLSGKRIPTQEQLSYMADPYGINPAWLMGYETSMFWEDTPIYSDKLSSVKLTPEENHVIILWRDASEDIKREINRLLDYSKRINEIIKDK